MPDDAQRKRLDIQISAPIPSSGRIELRVSIDNWDHVINNDRRFIARLVLALVDGCVRGLGAKDA